MKTKLQRGVGAALAAGAVTALATAPALAEQPGTTETMSPSTSTPPYVVPVAGGVRTTSLLTVGESVDGYRMVGIPDGLGAYRNDGNSLTLVMNHELRDTQGVARRHGQPGAFVSEWSIDRKSLEVTRGEDLINPGIQYWDYLQSQFSLTPNGAGVRADGKAFAAFSPTMSRFCSNTLSDPGQLFNEETGNGYEGQLFFPNEENGDRGRGFALTMDGQLYQLPRLGLFSWENTIPAHNQSDTTLVMGQEDAADGQIWLYEGTKTNSGSAIDKAGLTNGANYVAAVAGATTDKQFRDNFGKNNPQRFTPSEVDWDQEGGPQNAEAKADGITLNRIEDGAFDPSNPNDFYFLTTEGGKGADTPTNFYGRDGGGLWRMRFDDIENPQAGGTLTLLLDGSEAPYFNKPDNMTIDGNGNLLIQEDPGNNVSVARIVAYRIADGARGVVAQFDPALFGWKGAKLANGNPLVEAGQITLDEESSGIIDAHSTIGPRWFLFDAQVHKANPDPELVEEGQMLALHVDRWQDVYDIEG